MENEQISILKMNGKHDVFDARKLRLSLKNSGATDDMINHVLSEVSAALYENISTEEIHKIAFSRLRQYKRSIAARYKLKKALLEMGPSGFPFEKIVEQTLIHQGYQTETDQILEGVCVKHEVDVIAQKDNRYLLVECKFHSEQSRQSDVKIPLYIQSRFHDIKQNWKKLNQHQNKIHEGWIFTNTRFSKDAIQYGNCMGIKLVDWDSPAQGSLKELIDQAGLHPITCLTSLSLNEKHKLLNENIVLCKELMNSRNILFKIDIHKQRHSNILSEAKQLCNL
ncbi:restriction endonuclease [Lishizhenia sp.]|uniref:restriction endonuclease n=1 Tax=Lishizhenia sp. TaxID=2497594 RepID=UPI00299DDB3C|nr:restriction endonuclease [Lishizhenia sp.]MDX1445726.1 restriction endonuclease [Lishizhenia sp.]